MLGMVVPNIKISRRCQRTERPPFYVVSYLFYHNPLIGSIHYKLEVCYGVNNRNATASYRVIADGGGNRYCFYCDLSGIAICTTGPVQTGSADKDLETAWENEGKQQFNLCKKCGKWVSDVMYNADVLQCVDCAPWEDYPRFCKECGTKAAEGDTVCQKCGARLRYGEVTCHGF